MKSILAGLLFWTSAQALTVETATTSDGVDPARIRVRLVHHPDREPISALRARIHLDPSLPVSSLALLTPATGRWSRVSPEIDREDAGGGILEVLAMAPDPAAGEGAGPAEILSLDLALAHPIAADRHPVDSVVILEALDPLSHPLRPEILGAESVLTAGAGSGGHPRIDWRPVEGMHTVSFRLSRPTAVRARVEDGMGRPVRVLALGLFAPGRQRVEWDGRDSSGRHAPAGRYVLKLRLGSLTYRETLVRPR